MNTDVNIDSRYHHGDLTKALGEVAIDMARAGGPEAVVLREAARQVGVSATAAYRHFSGHSDLLLSVKRYAHALLTASMRDELARRDTHPEDPLDFAAVLKALGWGYIRFARDEPGLFRTAYHRLSQSRRPVRDDDHPPYQLISSALDRLPGFHQAVPDDRCGSRAAVWAAVHGLALLFVDGPLVSYSEVECRRVSMSTLDIVIRGICGQSAFKT